MKRWVASGLVVVAVVGWWLWPESEPVAFEAPTTEVARWLPRSVEQVPTEPVLAEQVAWTRQVRALGIACELPMRTVCDGGRCAAMTQVPLLNHPMGWAQMLGQSPALVASVVAGDLGLPDRVLPCRSAIRDMGMRTVARSTGGGELWCLVEGDDPAGLCDQLAGGEGFVEGADRIVELRPPGS